MNVTKAVNLDLTHGALAARQCSPIQGRETRAGGSGLRGPRRCSRPSPGSKGELPPGGRQAGSWGPGHCGRWPGSGRACSSWQGQSVSSFLGPQTCCTAAWESSHHEPLSSSMGSLAHPRRLAHWIRPLQQPWGVAAKRPHAERTENQRHFRLTPKTVITRRGAIPRVPRVPRLQT